MNSLLFRLILVCVCSAVISMANAQVPESERQALIDFYHATNGEHWHDNEGWLGEEGSECDWFGVWCHDTDEPVRPVRALSMPSNGLIGTLPESLAVLSELQSLQLKRNELSGNTLAISLALPQLRGLNLSHNPLGPLPETLPDTIPPLCNWSYPTVSWKVFRQLGSDIWSFASSTYPTIVSTATSSLGLRQ